MANKSFRNKLKKMGIIGTISLFLAGCGKDDFDSQNNVPVAIYGPPEGLEITVSPSPDDYFDPSENEINDVYGPPIEDWEDDENYDPRENEIPCVYGPPESFEDDGPK